MNKKLKVIDENEIYLEKLREVKEKEIGSPTSYCEMTPYTCGGETTIEATGMKHEITFEDEMKHLYETTLGKGLPGLYN